ncbi:hypothetical protein FUAX_14530 [Fulvitalea axinellae]|uniref:Transposase n=1 Tax=Fulvitalea axinellae TaxID=1182444 RepID=A0AAU9CA40_9BACT|nr:hypothetical protein FUAX_14530 [Fulvitalea axinellae]
MRPKSGSLLLFVRKMDWDALGQNVLSLTPFA